MSIAARLGQAAVVLVIGAAGLWWAARYYGARRELALERFRRHQEP